MDLDVSQYASLLPSKKSFVGLTQFQQSTSEIESFPTNILVDSVSWGNALNVECNKDTSGDPVMVSMTRIAQRDANGNFLYSGFFDYAESKFKFMFPVNVPDLMSQTMPYISFQVQ